jgi:tetratricopeptide (TPR) repeat protein
MKTKIENLISTLEDKDLPRILSLIPTHIMGGQQKHEQYLQKIWKNPHAIGIDMSTNARLIMSELCRIIEKYIVIRESLRSESFGNQVLLKHFRLNENEKLFNEYFRRVDNLHDCNLKNTEYYAQNSELLYEKWQFDQVKSRFSNAKAEEIILYKDIALISQKLMSIVSLAPQSTLISKQINTSLIDHLEPYILQNNYLDYPCISLYYYALKMLREPENEDWFAKFRFTLDTNTGCFNNDELKTLYFQAINYCIRKHNLGDKSYSELLLNYYKTALENGFLLINGFLSKNTYRNINTIAIRMGNYEQAKQISDNFMRYLRQDDQESAHRFNMANILYASQKYDEALQSLRYAEFDDHLSNLFAKTLMLKIYYESKAARLLDSHLDAMQVYLMRKKIIGYHKTNYLNIVKYTRKLMKLNPYDKSDHQKLADKIRTEKFLPDRDWLLKQVENKNKPDS